MAAHSDTVGVVDSDMDLIAEFSKNVLRAFKLSDGDADAVNIPHLMEETGKLGVKAMEEMRSAMLLNPTIIGHWYRYDRTLATKCNWETMMELWCPVALAVIHEVSHNHYGFEESCRTMSNFVTPFESLFDAICSIFAK